MPTYWEHRTRHTPNYTKHISVSSMIYCQKREFIFFSGIYAHIFIFLSTILRHRSIIAEMKTEMKDMQKELLQLSHKSIQEHHESSHQSASHNSTNTFVTPPAPGALQQSQYGAVKYWTKASWQEYVDRAKDRNSGHEPTWTEFITDEKCLQMSKQRHKELWEDAKIAWNSLYYRRLDPTNWSKKHTTAADYFYNTILQKYPEFRLCEGNWKLQMWATRRYSDWTKNVRGGGGLSRMFLYHTIQFTFYSSVYLQGADPSITQVGEKRPSNSTERDDKSSKKARPSVKKETIKNEKLPTLAPAPSVIIVDDGADSDTTIEYISDSDSKLINAAAIPPLLQSLHRSSGKTANLDVVGLRGHKPEVRRVKSYTVIRA